MNKDLASAIGNEPVAAYVYTREDKGFYYFGLVRKLYEDGRQIIPRRNSGVGYILDGAAGTDKKYWGKWTSIGGNRDGTKSHIEAIIDELNHETGLGPSKRFTTHDVGFDIESNPDPKKSYKIDCKYIEEINGVIMCTLKILDHDLFFEIFPKSGKTSSYILQKSQGEIDATKAFKLLDIFNLQEEEVRKKNNNYFISYFLKNFSLILNRVAKDSPNKDKFNTIKIISDTESRYPDELIHKPYIRDASGRYN